MEQELCNAAPRPMVWSHKFGIPKEIEDLLVNGMATTATITKADTGWLAGYEAGPFYHIDYEFEFEGKIWKGRWEASYDGMHLAYGAGTFYNWLEETMVEGKSFTILFDKKDPSKSKIYKTLRLDLNE